MLANHPNVLSGGGVATNIIGGTGLFADGTVAAPSISFLADQDTGIYRIGADSIGFAANGALRARIDVNGITSFSSVNQLQTTDYAQLITGTNMQMALLSGTGNTSGKLEVYNTGGATGGVLNINTGGGGAVNFGSGNATFGGNILLPQNGVIGKSASFALQFGGADYGFVNTSSGHCVLFSNSAPTNSLVIASSGTATFAGAVLNANGTAAAPSISFASDTNTGFYSISDNVLGLALGGSAKIAFYDSGGAQIRDPATNALLQFTSATGSVSLNANSSGSGAALTVSGGANANITLTPSGTGVTMLVGNSVSPLWLNKGSGAGGIVFSFNGTTYLSSITTSESSATANCYMDLGVATGANTTTQQVLRLIGNGRALIGTTVDSGALLQVGTNTSTSAYGMVFGTDTFLYRVGNGSLAIDGSSSPAIYLRYSGTNYCRLLYNNGSDVRLESSSTFPLLFMVNSVTVLTLDSSQNATFAGTAITLASAAAKAGLRIPHGAAPTTPTDGDMWSTTAGLFIRINGVTKTVTLT
jgi:hypothetical protein